MVLVGVLAAVVGCLLHTWAAMTAAQLNFGSRLPYLSGTYPVRPTRRIKRAQTAGWLLSIVGALGIGGALWDTAPGWSFGTVIAILVVVNAGPNLVMTAIHNRRGAQS